MRSMLPSLVLIGFLATTKAADQNPWNAWERELRQQCPAHHVDWLSGGGYDDLLAGFTKTLPHSMQRRVESIADNPHRCSDVHIGFDCEMSVYLDAFSKLGLLKQFAAYGCRQYKCTEPALCTHLAH